MNNFTIHLIEMQINQKKKREKEKFNKKCVVIHFTKNKHLSIICKN